MNVQRPINACLLLAASAATLLLSGCIPFTKKEAYSGTTQVRAIGDSGSRLSGWYIQDGKRKTITPQWVPWSMSGARISHLRLYNETTSKDIQVELTYLGTAAAPAKPEPGVQSEIGFLLREVADIKVENGFRVTSQ